jgi:hypothetical protein
VALRQVFFEHFGFPCQFSLNRLLCTHDLSSGAGTVGQLVIDVPSGLSLTLPQETRERERRLGNNWMREFARCSAIFKKYLHCVLAARIFTVHFVVCTLTVKIKIRAGFDMSDRTIPL